MFPQPFLWRWSSCPSLEDIPSIPAQRTQRYISWGKASPSSDLLRRKRKHASFIRLLLCIVRSPIVHSRVCWLHPRGAFCHEMLSIVRFESSGIEAWTPQDFGDVGEFELRFEVRTPRTRRSLASDGLKRFGTEASDPRGASVDATRVGSTQCTVSSSLRKVERWRYPDETMEREVRRLDSLLAPGLRRTIPPPLEEKKRPRERRHSPSDPPRIDGNRDPRAIRFGRSETRGGIAASG